jgi:nicotinamidase-related amidase
MKTALLVIDVQEGTAADKPHHLESLVGGINTLVDRFRVAGAPVIFVRHEGEGEFVGIFPKGDEKVIRKKFNSAFRDTDLKDHLSWLNIDRLVVTGMQTDYCIDTTVRVAFELGFKVVVPEGLHSTADSGALKAEQIIAHHQGIWKVRFAEVLAPDKVMPA